MRIRRLLYWFVTGVCFGLGLDVFAFGLLFVAGIVLLVVGVCTRTGREAVAVALGVGAGSAALMALLTQTNFQGGPPVPLALYTGLTISILSTIIGLVSLIVVLSRSQRGAAAPR